ncbi:hypothetical protein F5883DRAFT_184714 [Diaporthe sp. PMI_573]|nr:hypothetical protein F5883DRAFT_184714 [Diaporthaceae sp. PMI_573]
MAPPENNGNLSLVVIDDITISSTPEHDLPTIEVASGCSSGRTKHLETSPGAEEISASPSEEVLEAPKPDGCVIKGGGGGVQRVPGREVVGSPPDRCQTTGVPNTDLRVLHGVINLGGHSCDARGDPSDIQIRRLLSLQGQMKYEKGKLHTEPEPLELLVPAAAAKSADLSVASGQGSSQESAFPNVLSEAQGKVLSSSST